MTHRRVMTFNIHSGIGIDGIHDLERIARIIAEQRPDAVALQEVDQHYSDRSEFLDQASWLGTRLKMHSYFAGNVSRQSVDRDGRLQKYGLATLSKTPAVKDIHIPLPTSPGLEPRGVLITVLTIEGSQISLLNTHLQHNSAIDRFDQATAVCKLPEAHGTAIVAGDLNAPPSRREILIFSDLLDDAWSIAGSGKGCTSSTKNPLIRIDYIFTSRDIRVDAVQVIPNDASDHLALVADVSLVP